MRNSKSFGTVHMARSNILSRDFKRNFEMFLEEWEPWYETLITIEDIDFITSDFRKFTRKLKNWNDVFALKKWRFNTEQLIYCCKNLKPIFANIIPHLEWFHYDWLSVYDSEEENDGMDSEKENNQSNEMDLEKENKKSEETSLDEDYEISSIGSSGFTEEEELTMEKLAEKYSILYKKMKNIVKTIDAILKIN